MKTDKLSDSSATLVRIMPATMGCAQDLAWASNVLGLGLHRLDQVRMQHVYCFLITGPAIALI